jgi:hypothetical protein
MNNPVSSMVNSSKAVDEIVSRLPEEIKNLAKRLRKIILTSSVQITEQVNHNIPFYHYKGQLCYINPFDDRVVLGFSRGADLPDEHSMLKGNQKTIRHTVFYPDAVIDEEKVRNLVYEALIVNELKADRPGKGK